jgi:glycosyltransferase involved in cell wall biosynthesis
MNSTNLLRVAVLIDLPRTRLSGGHVKCWERLAQAAAQNELPLDLTIYFSCAAPDEVLGPHTRFRHLPPIFSTANLKFLPYVPDHTDLAPYHWQLARELAQYDVIHTTDGFFAFAQTAERVSRKQGIPLVTSFHTDTPSYTRIFTKQTIEKIFAGWPRIRHTLIDAWKMPERKEQAMQEKLERHVSLCDYALVTRKEDHDLADAILGSGRVRHLRLGVDKAVFNPSRKDRETIEKTYHIPPNRIVFLFVGRVDVGKNIYTLIQAMEKLIKDGMPLHLIVAGVGPASGDVKKHLGDHAGLPGFVEPDELARLYASVDALALSSEVEIRSMTGVEAMASGCPVLVSRKSGVWELFNHTPAMQPVDGGVENWAQALHVFASNTEKQNTMRAAAHDYNQHHLASWQNVLAEDLFTVWQQSAREHKRKAA